MDSVILKELRERMNYYRNESGKYSAMKKDNLAAKYEYLASGLEEAEKMIVSAQHDQLIRKAI